MPLRHGHLTCDQERSFVVAIVDDLEKVAGLVGCKWLGPPVVDYDQICAFQYGHQASQPSLALGEIGEQT